MNHQSGFPIGNFGIAGEVSPSGRLLGRVMYNPPVLGPWLEELGRGRFVFTCDGVSIADEGFESKRVERLFPEASAEYADSRFDGLTIRASLFAPIAARDAFTCSVPAICAEIEIANSLGWERQVSVRFDLDRHDADGPRMALLFNDRTSREELDKGSSAFIQFSVPAKCTVGVRFMLLCHDPNGYYAQQCPTIGELAQWVWEHWEQFSGDRAELIGLLPRTPDPKINEYLRWYLSAAVMLTRLTREHVLTMGYCELNQRDSYWTSWPHLVLWPELERRMIEESAEHQRENGKIPTTILPTIEREDDIDVNCYFSLRLARYYEWTRDIGFLRQLWPAFKRSAAYLKGLDRDGDGLVEQGSFWADWKDVIGVEGRKAAPHFEFLWLAVLKYAKQFAGILDDCAAIEEYSALYQRASDAVNANAGEGGLWNGRFYTTLWFDGREDKHCQQDQLVGPLYGVVPEERIASIYESIDLGMTDWGIRDTWPYRDQFNNVGGDYHNGGVWIFLNFADAFSRFTTGYPNGAWEILKRVGHWDLEKWGDYMPAEYLDGNTGANAGKPIQGWDACFFGAVLFGALGVRVLESNKVEVLPRIPYTETFDTPIPLPWGVLRVRQAPSDAALEVRVTSELSQEITLRYGAMMAEPAAGASTVRIGECEFSVVQLVLPSQSTALLRFEIGDGR